MASVYDEIGGGDAVAAAVDQFYLRVLGDPELGPYFEHTGMRKQKSHMRAFLAAALGGPQLYAGRDLRAAHPPARVTAPAFGPGAVHLAAPLEGLGVPMPIIEAIGGKLVPLREQIVAA